MHHLSVLVCLLLLNVKSWHQTLLFLRIDSSGPAFCSVAFSNSVPDSTFTSSKTRQLICEPFFNLRSEERLSEQWTIDATSGGQQQLLPNTRT